MKRLLLSTFIFLGTIGASLSYPTTAAQIDLDYCMTQEIAIEGILKNYPNATHVDSPSVVYFITPEEPTTLVIYFNEQGCADAYEFLKRTPA